MLAVIAILALVAAALGLLLFGVLRQLAVWAELLEHTPADSNLRLPCAVRLPDALRAADAINARLSGAQNRARQAQNAGRELQYTMAAVSHDIRTPLTGAAGYLELLRETDDPQKRREYQGIIARRLSDLSTLLDELFLYTRMAGEEGEKNLPRAAVPLYPALCEALAALYPKLEAAGVEPQLDFQDEALTVRANHEALGRVFRNLILNAAQHGQGPLQIKVAERVKGKICIDFTNAAPEAKNLDPAHLFDRFWRADKARGAQKSTGAGLGLSIVRQLTEKMGGTADAALQDGSLTITVSLPKI